MRKGDDVIIFHSKCTEETLRASLGLSCIVHDRKENRDV